MRVGVVILPQFSWPEARARWKSLEDSGFAHGWTYDHLAWRDLAEQNWFGTIPTLTAAATATSTLRLGTWVTSPNFRHPVTLAKDLMTLDDISGGRVIVGDRCGWNRLGRNGSGSAAAHSWAAGGTARRVRHAHRPVAATQPKPTWHGDYFQAERARMIPAGSRARIPLIVAANGPRTMRIAAGADGWATTGPESTDATTEQWWDAVAALVAKFEATADNAGRDPATMDRYLNLDSAPVLSVSSIDAFTDAAGRAAALGFTDILVHWPRPDGVYAADDAVLDQIADLLTDGHLRA